jgi:polyferredoxin
MNHHLFEFFIRINIPPFPHKNVNMTNDKVHYLSKVEMLSGLDDRELNEIAADFEWQEYPRGADIISQGQDRHGFYVLAEGTARVLVDREGRDSLQINCFYPGDVFGEIALFTGKPSPNTVRCTEDCRVLALDPEHFARILLRWPKLHEKLIDRLSHRLHQVKISFWEAKHKEFLRSGLQLHDFHYKFYGLWGSARITREVEDKLTELSKTGGHLLVTGERGTGRQMLAWFLHKRQYGEEAPFIVVDSHHFEQQWCDPDSLLDLAGGGTLFIREVNMLPPGTQLKLAEALHSREAACRVTASLRGNGGQLSPGLVPRLRDCFTQSYKITPLRERKRDIPVIAQGILERLACKHNRKTPVLSREATKLLLSHHYCHGNVTELIRIVERAFFLAEGDVISLEHVFFGPNAEKTGRSINLLSFSWVEKLIKKGVIPSWIQGITTLIFIFIVVLLFLAPEKEAAVVLFILVWGLWWPALTIFSPLFGRVWCGICPFSGTMELVQKYFHLDRPVLDLLKKYNYLLITFLFLLVFWVEAVTGMRFNPLYTGLWLICITAAAAVTGIIFPRHTWCHYLCPLGGFVGMASVGGMLEIRADASVCLNKCATHECYRGTANVPGCPMSQYVPFVDNNLDCKLCFRCVRNCPNGAAEVNLRFPGREVWHLVRVNQGFVIFIGVALAVLIPINLFEGLHSVLPPPKWRLWFSLAFWGTALTAGILTQIIARPFRTEAASRRIKLVFAFIPLVLAGYVIYQLQFVPGIESLSLGFVYGSSGSSRAFYFPALSAGRAIAAAIGLLQTGFTLFMVFHRSKTKP